MARKRSSKRSAGSALAGMLVVAALGGYLLLQRPNPDTTQFWQSLFLEAIEAEHYDSLAEMRDASDAVVLGHIVSVSEGRIFGDPPDDIVQYVTAIVDVERVLKGQVEVVSEGQLQLEIMVPGSASISEVTDAAPGSQSIFFLRHKASELARLGAAPDVVAADRLFYRLVILRGVVWESSGVANVMDVGESDFLTQLAGQPMEDVIRSSTP